MGWWLVVDGDEGEDDDGGQDEDKDEGKDDNTGGCGLTWTD